MGRHIHSLQQETCACHFLPIHNGVGTHMGIGIVEGIRRPDKFFTFEKVPKPVEFVTDRFFHFGIIIQSNHNILLIFK
jgi:hypothetical protein